MENLGYYNGKYALIEEMQIPMQDRVCYFGDGVYDATCAANHVIYALDEHIDRFYHSADLLKMNIPHTKEELKDILTSMVKKVDSPTQFVYWQVTRGTAQRNHIFPDTSVKGNFWMMLTPVESKQIREKIRLITQEDTRFLHCNIKTLNLIPNVMAAQQAEEAGAQEAVFHRGGRVTECAHSNVSILKDGVFITAPTDHLILPGIARKHLIEMCRKNNITVDETPFNLKELMQADEVIVSSSSNFCLSASHIDGKAVGGKAPELLLKLQDSLLEKFHKATGTVD
ncbi:aminotransferase class IV [Lachnospiraceae bacterium ZAX-1]